LSRYPDIARTGIDPYLHYIKHGRGEGRIAVPPELPTVKGGVKLQKGKKTLLIVTHEASRTGAPVLALNLAQKFIGNYNIIVFSLGAGELLAHFATTSCVVAGPVNPRDQDAYTMSCLVGQLLDSHRIDLAVVNSICSRNVLPELGRRFIPTISLIHEFASYTRPESAIAQAALWSTSLVFSSSLTMQNAIDTCPALENAYLRNLPQGRSMLPVSELPDDLELEHKRMTEAFFSDIGEPRPVVILGAGSVEYRKGVDLFLACAAKVRQRAPSRRFRFVWIGRGFDPHLDRTLYSAFLADQVGRQGTEENVAFIDSVTDLEFAYRQADIFFLSSRLDPLPNVAIDAMAFSLPVMCFDKGTGVAEAMHPDELAGFCVLPYLDVDCSAERIVRLIEDEALRHRIGERVRAIGATWFNMDRYVSELQDLGMVIQEQVAQERLDFETLKSCERICRDFIAPSSHVAVRHEDLVRHFVRAWASGIERRKPFPGFNPAVYAATIPVGDPPRDPTARFIDAGFPDGPWCTHVISSSDDVVQLPDGQAPRVALLISVPDDSPSERLAAVRSALFLNKTQVDLTIRVASGKSADLAHQMFGDFDRGTVVVEPDTNWSFGLVPVLRDFSRKHAGPHDVIGHLPLSSPHHTESPKSNESWFRFVTANMLGSGFPMLDHIVSSMARDQQLGLVFPDDPNIFECRLATSSDSGLEQENHWRRKRATAVDFPVGGAFWARWEAIEHLFQDDFVSVAECNSTYPLTDGDASTVEKRLPEVATQQGFKTAVTYARGISY
jgi:glycosyltransferase involved in cell wall biosynthesis